MFGIPRRTIHLYSGELRDLLRAAAGSASEQRALVAAFEDAFTRHIGVRHAIPVGAGRLGLRLILRGLEIGPGDGVMLPAFTDQSVPNAIRKAGAEPILVDVNRETMNLDPDRLEASYRPNARALIATHLFGAPCDMEPIFAFARAKGLEVLEDCAHAIDASAQGRRCGSLGRAAIFSFVVTKAVNTFGGGMVCTNDDALAASIRQGAHALPLPDLGGLLRRIAVGYALNSATGNDVFGWLGLPLIRGLRASGADVVRSYDRIVRPGTRNDHVDTAFSPLQAAVGLQQLRDLPATQAARHNAVAQLLPALPKGLRAQTLLPGDQHAYYFLIATAEDPAAMVTRLLSVGIDVGTAPMRNVAALEAPESGARDFPGAQYLYEHSIQIPIHPTLGVDAVRTMAARLRSLRGGGS